METNKDNDIRKEESQTPASHPPTDHNPYPYPIAQPNRKGWIRALISLILVAVVVTIVCLVVGIYNHHEKSVEEVTAVENVILP